jgi:hypothetical protein
MDSGCSRPEAEVEELYDVSRPLLPEEVLGIIDQLLCHEVSSDGLYCVVLQTLIFLLDVMAFGIPSLSNDVHQLLRGGPLYAGSSKHSRSYLCSQRRP